MKEWLRGPRGGLLSFLIISGLVVGGLGWATAAALRLEQEQLAQRRQAKDDDNLRIAMWRLDGRITPILAREQSRPFDHYSTIFAPPLVFNNEGACMTAGTVLELSPLLSADLPDWMLLHFQINTRGWESPQVPSPELIRQLRDAKLRQFLCCTQDPKGAPVSTPALPNVTSDRKRLLNDLKGRLPAQELLALARQRTEPATLRDTTLLYTGNASGGQQPAPVPPPIPPSDTQTLNQPTQTVPSSQPPIPPNFPAQQTANLPDLGQRQQMPYGMGGFNQQKEVGQNSANSLNNDSRIRNFYSQQGMDNPKDNSRRLPRSQVTRSTEENGAQWLAKAPPPVKEILPRPGKKEAASSETEVNLSPMVPVWAEAGPGEEPRLLLLRMVRIEDKEICQGIILAADRLRPMLLEVVTDLFPEADLVPERDLLPEDPNRTMSALPFKLETGSAQAPADPGWTPLRVGLSLAWAAAGIALLATYLGGASLLDLSERRIRFVSAVTHELRTPLTTLRLYLDMLLGGMVRDEKQREEYLHTLNAEADRLNRLVGNVLDFSRLEKQRPQLNWTQATVAELLTQVQSTWQGRCQDAGKTLQVEMQLPPETALRTDPALVQQVLANLLDNACKYSRGAEDCRLWLRVRQEQGRVVFEVEDRGPGVAPAERRSIFRAFRRGRTADVTGGVGLGLALAQRWARLLGGRLALRATGPEGGACFQLWLPG